MAMRIVTKLFGLTIFLGLAGDFKLEQRPNSDPRYDVAVRFINDYVDFLSEKNSDLEITEWVQQQSTVTDRFKSGLQKFIEETEFLDFDPILDSQDYPEGFKIDKTASEFVIVKGTDWPEFKLVLKLDQQGEQWFVDGSGVINVPEDKRIVR